MDGRTRRAVDEHAGKATREQLTLIRTFEQLRERGSNMVPAIVHNFEGQEFKATRQRSTKSNP
jgi:hypothetical protein